MQLVNAFVRHPVKVSVGVLLVALFGGIALARMPMQLTPEVDVPTLTVETRWPGASPQEVEREIVLEQEEQLKSVEGLRKMTSESSDSRARITLEFPVGVDMDEVLLRVNSRLQQVREYPEDADEPVISTSNASDRPIAWFILSPKRPTLEELDALATEHPDLASDIARIKSAPTAGVAGVRLRRLAEAHAEAKSLLPPPDLDVTKLRRFAEDEIEARFERVAGVSNSNVMGGLEDELQIIVDPEKLASRQISLTRIRDVLRGQNADVSGGDFWEGKRRWVVRSLNQFRSPEQVEEQLIAVVNGAPVFIRDVAEVRLGYKKPDGVVRRYGESSIAVNCERESGANVLDVMDGLRQAAAELNAGILGQRGLEIAQVYDETEYIYSAVNLVQQNIFIGGALTMIVLMLFLDLQWGTLLAVPAIAITALGAAYISPWFFAVTLVIILAVGFTIARGSIVVGLAIPTSLIGAFLVLGLLGRSLNVISLAGLAFAVGMLVDNAVVVLENIYRRHALGEPPFTAAVRGTQEVLGAVTASTLTTISVFLPVVFVQEEAGQLFRDIALAVTGAVGLSMIVSLTVIPTAAARLFRDGARRAPDEPVAPPHGNGRPASDVNGHVAETAARQVAAPTHRGIQGFLERLGGGFISAVVGVNAAIQRHAVIRASVVAALVAASGVLTWVFWPQVEYLPSGNRNLVFGNLMPPPGYNLNELQHLGEIVEERLRPYWDVDPESPEAAKLDYPAIQDFFFVARGRQVFMGLRSFDPTRTGELVPLVLSVANDLPGTIAVAKQSSLFERGLSAGRTVEIEIVGPELEKLVALGGRVMGQIQGVVPNSQARPVPSLDLSTPELHVRPKLVQSADLGVSAAELGFSVNALVDGAYAGDYYLGGDKIDLTIVGEEQYARRTQDVAALPIAAPDGQLIPLSALADVTLASGPEQVNHRERMRAITVEVSPPPETPLEAAMSAISEQIVSPMLASGELPPGYQMRLAGTADKLRETWQSLRFNVFLAVVITYLLMAALFESWLYPFVIILSVPLGAVGGVLGLWVLNLFILQPLDVLTMLGFVILIGTVVNNPILIVHQSLNYIRDEGYAPRAAVLESVRTRIRPIFMTTLTTVLGLLPLVLFPGAGSELYRGLGSVVLGGLIVSTVFTLVFVPTMFTLMWEARESLARRLFPQPAVEAPPAPPRSFDSVEPQFAAEPIAPAREATSLPR